MLVLVARILPSIDPTCHNRKCMHTVGGRVDGRAGRWGSRKVLGRSGADRGAFKHREGPADSLHKFRTLRISLHRSQIGCNKEGSEITHCECLLVIGWQTSEGRSFKALSLSSNTLPNDHALRRSRTTRARSRHCARGQQRNQR